MFVLAAGTREDLEGSSVLFRRIRLQHELDRSIDKATIDLAGSETEEEALQ